RIRHEAREFVEDPGHLVGEVAIRAGEPALKHRKVRLIADLQICGDQIVLAAEVIIKRALGHAGLRRYGIDTHGADTLAVEQFGCSFQNAIARRYGRLPHSSSYHASMYTGQ